MRSYTGKRSFKCAYCDKVFADGSSRKKHERIHTGEKPYACPVCPKKFNQRVLLRSHVQNIHAKSKPKQDFKVKFYRCKVCDIWFISSSKFCTHLIQHSDENKVKSRNSSVRTLCKNIDSQIEPRNSNPKQVIQSSSIDQDNFVCSPSNVAGLSSKFPVQTHKIDNSRLVKNLQKSSNQVTNGPKNAIPEPKFLSKEQKFKINNGKYTKKYLTALDSDNLNRLGDEVSLENIDLINVKIEPNNNTTLESAFHNYYNLLL